jgi:hypothetical protein
VELAEQLVELAEVFAEVLALAANITIDVVTGQEDQVGD